MNTALKILGILVLLAILYILLRAIGLFNKASNVTANVKSNVKSTIDKAVDKATDNDDYVCRLVDASGKEVVVRSATNNALFQQICSGQTQRPIYISQRPYYIRWWRFPSWHKPSVPPPPPPPPPAPVE